MTDESDTGSPRYVVECNESVPLDFARGFFIGMSVDLVDTMTTTTFVVSGDIDMESLTEWDHIDSVRGEVQD